MSHNCFRVGDRTDNFCFSDMGPIFVTAAKDGSVNVLSLMVETSGSDISVMGTYFAFACFLLSL